MGSGQQPRRPSAGQLPEVAGLALQTNCARLRFGHPQETLGIAGADEQCSGLVLLPRPTGDLGHRVDHRAHHGAAGQPVTGARLPRIGLARGDGRPPRLRRSVNRMDRGGVVLLARLRHDTSGA